MLYAYLFAMTLGGVLLATSLIGGHSDGDADAADHAHGDSHGDHDHGWAVFSLRFWTYFLAFGGLTGFLLRTVAKVGEPWSVLLGALVGLGSGAAGVALLRRGAAEGVGTTDSAEDFVGKAAHVLVPFSSGGTGQVRLRLRDRDIDLLAVCDEPGLAFETREEVLVLEVREGRAHIARSPVALPPPSGRAWDERDKG